MNLSRDFQKGVIKDSYGYFFEKYGKFDEQWEKIFDTRTIDAGDYWQETSVIGPRLLQKTGGGEGYKSTLLREGYTSYGAIFDFTDSISFHYNTISDVNKFNNILREAAKGWGEGAPLTRDQFYANWFNKGGFTSGYWAFNGTPESGAITDSSGNGCYDSASSSAIVALFARTGDTYKHTSKVGQTSYYNALASGVVTDASITDLVTLVEVTNAYDERDVKVPIEVDTIVYPKNQWKKVPEILQSSNIAHELSNTKQLISKKFKNQIEWPSLTDTDAIFVGQAKMGLVALEKQEPKIDFYEVKDDRVWKAAISMRIGGLMNNFRFWGSDNLAQS